MRPALDVAAVRAGFRSLARTVDGRAVVFADAPGGTQVPDAVIDAMSRYLRTSNANTGGAFATSAETDRLIREARVAASDLLGGDPSGVVFGQNMTTAAFAFARTFGRDLRPGDEVVVTVLDHDANIAPWLIAARDRGATVRWADVHEGDGTLDLDSLDRALSGRTRLVAFTLASNALGTVTPVEEIVGRVRASSPGALLVADAVHLAQHRPIDVRRLGVDVLFCSAYKVFGPHLGVMWGRAEVLARLTPDRVRPAPEAVPDRWETGTLNHEGLAGFVAAIDRLASLGEGAGRRDAIVAGFEAIERHEAELSRRFLEAAADVPGLRVYGISEPHRVAERTPTFAVRFGDRSPRSVATELGDRGIFAWDGNYFAPAIMERLGLEPTGGAVRVGFCHYHTVEEVDRVVNELRALADRR